MPLGIPWATLGRRCGKGLGELSFREGLFGRLGYLAAPFGSPVAPFWHPSAGFAVFFFCHLFFIFFVPNFGSVFDQKVKVL